MVRGEMMKYKQRGLRPWSPIPTCMPQAHAHHRLCEVCESAPTTVICKADAASLCTTCDADIHSVNPLARLHVRVPIHQYQPSKCYGDDMTHNQNHHCPYEKSIIREDDDGDDEKEANSWLLPDPAGKNPSSEAGSESLLFGGSEVDEYLDLVDYGEPCSESQTHVHSQYSEAECADSVVPVRGMEIKDQQQSGHHCLDMEFGNHKGAYCYSGSLIHSISLSSLDVGIVPETTTTEYSGSYLIDSKEAIELEACPTTPIAPQLVSMDREARVLRYREKRKNRKFEKTIRYASRKAYAETRPRIKGRFVKRAHIEIEVDQICPAALMVEAGYGIVPTF